MATHTLSILKPSVNNLSVRVFVRAAGLDHEEVDMWGNKGTPEFLQKNPSDLTPLLEEEGLPKGSLWESCAIMQYLCNRDGLEQFYPSDPGKRAMVDSAMFYLVGTIYPLVARATYPTLGFPQYAGEVATSDADDAMKAKAVADATDALAAPLEAYNEWFLDGKGELRRRCGLPHDRRHPPRGHARVPAGDRLRAAEVGLRPQAGSRGLPGRRLLGARRRGARVRRLGQVTTDIASVFDAHVKAEFQDLDLEATMATMADDLPVTGVEQADALLDRHRPKNELIDRSQAAPS